MEHFGNISEGRAIKRNVQEAIMPEGRPINEMSRRVTMMRTADHQLQNEQTSGRARTRLIVLIAASCIGALVLVNAQSMRAEADVADVPASAITAPDSPSAAFDYFPAQYRNSGQSAAPEEHIQAF